MSQTHWERQLGKLNIAKDPFYKKNMDDICRHCIYTVYFICRDSMCWLLGCVKLAREICFRSEQKHVQQSVSRSHHAVRAASQGDLFTVRAKKFGWHEANVWLSCGQYVTNMWLTSHIEVTKWAIGSSTFNEIFVLIIW